MPGNYAITTGIVDGQTIDAADIKVPIDALDDKVKALADAPYITAAASSELNGETTLTTALASPPAIGGTTPAAITGTTLTATGAVSATGSITTSNSIIITGASGAQRASFYRTGTVNRWAFGTDAATESGSNAGTNFGIFRYADDGAYLGAPIFITRSSGNVSMSNNLSITGSLSKGSGSFKIPHPLGVPETWLYHGFIEGPRFDLIYRGRVQLVKGVAVISIDEAANMTPGTFEVLTRDPQLWLQNDTGWEPLKGSVADGMLTILCRDTTSDDVVSWMVVAERQDPHIYTSPITDKDGRLVPEQPWTDEDREVDAVNPIDEFRQQLTRLALMDVAIEGEKRRAPGV
jgi:hypothetical protein